MVRVPTAAKHSSPINMGGVFLYMYINRCMLQLLPWGPAGLSECSEGRFLPVYCVTHVVLLKISLIRRLRYLFLFCLMPF